MESNAALLAQCDGKIKFANTGEAQQSIRIRRSPWRMNPYLCKKCGKWHIGATRGEVPRRIKRRMSDQRLLAELLDE